MAVLELAMLSPTAKHCLETTIRSGGLVVGERGYTGRVARSGVAFTAAPVWQLMALRLVRCVPSDSRVLEATDLGIELNDYGVAEVTNPAKGLGLIDAGADQSEVAP
jgi:hypothetical protein